MTVTLPSWYEGNFVNVENLFIDMFGNVFPEFETGCWAPDDWLDDQLPPEPMIWFFRLPGGRVDWQARKDECQVQVMVVTGSRDDSWAVMDVIRSVLLPMQGDKVKMADGYMAQIQCASEVAGPQLLTPGQAIDTRVVSATFRVSVSMKTAKHYRDALSAVLRD